MSTETEADWLYDADRDDPLTALRIPVVLHAWPRWAYIVAFDLDEIDGATERPTSAEAAMQRSFLDHYCDRLRQARAVRAVRHRPLLLRADQ